MKAITTSMHPGIIIKNTRKVQGMSQTRLAEKIGVTYQMVQKYESGKSQLTIGRLKQIADALGISVNMLLDEKTYKADNAYVGLEDMELKLLKLFRKLDSEKLKDGFIGMLDDIVKLHLRN